MTARDSAGVSAILSIAGDRTGCASMFRVTGPKGTTWAEARSSAPSCGLSLPATGFVGPARVGPGSLVGLPPLVSGAIVTDAPAASNGDALVSLEAIEGPDCGARIAMSARSELIGRSRNIAPLLSDPQLSREHFTAAVQAGAVTVHCLRPTNELRIDGTAVMTAQVAAGQRIRAGGSTFVLRTPASDGRAHRPRGLAGDSSDCLEKVRLTSPTAPDPPSRRRIPWQVLALTVVLALGITVLTHNALFALFALLSPAMMVTGQLGDRVASKRQGTVSRADLARRRREFRARLEREIAAELTRRRLRDPSVAECAWVANGTERGRWSRRGTALRWRVGSGAIRSSLVVDGRHVVLPEAPVVIEHSAGTTVGIVGPPGITEALLSSLVLQGVTWQPPSALCVSVLTSPGHTVFPEWLPLLPHVHVTETLQTGTTTDSADVGASGTEPISRLIIVPAGSAARAPDSAPCDSVVALTAPTVEALSMRCDVIITATDRLTVEVRNDSAVRRAIPDLPSRLLCWTISRTLAPLEETTASATKPLNGHLGLLELFGQQRAADLTEVRDVQRLWQRSTERPTALVGMTQRGPWEVDLCADGPHMLVAGTTGSGKSELLRSFIVALAADQPPDRLSFVLIDYKGGSAFSECADLPHTVGLVTDLDASLTERALTCLEAELKRRERILAEIGARDLDDFTSRGGRLARLVLIVDEFRVLSEELPEFVSGLVRIAAVGRSLGIHLVLATQRPSGVVSADIRANVGLRIALRVRDGSDSHDVVECADAARLPPGAPGRAVVRTPDLQVMTVQTARVESGPVSLGAVRVIPWPISTPVPNPAAHSDNSALPRVVAAMRRAADALDIPPQASPWPPPLATSCSDLDLPRGAVARSVFGAPSARTDAFALIDLPNEQCIRSLVWQPQMDGHLCLVGGARSGRTSALRTLIHRAAAASDCYVVDLAGGLTDLEQLSGVAVVAGRDEPGLISRILMMLEDMIRSRTSGPPPPSSAPREAILFVDGWDALSDLSDEVTQGALVDQLVRIMRDGSAGGVFVVATGGRALLTGRSASHFASRIALRLTDPTELLLAGLRSDTFQRSSPPGRGVLLGSGEMLQILDRIPLPERRVRPPVAPGRLPDRVRWTRRADRSIGMTFGDTPVAWPADRGRLVGLVSGPPRSGRSNALRLIAALASMSTPVAWVGPRPPTMVGLSSYEPEDTEGLSCWFAANPAGLILLDDADRGNNTGVEDAVVAHLLDRGSAIGSGDPAALASRFRGAVPLMRRSGTGIALLPSRASAELFGLPLGLIGPVDRPRPGRGVMVARGRVQPVQLAAHQVAPAVTTEQ